MAVTRFFRIFAFTGKILMHAVINTETSFVFRQVYPYLLVANVKCMMEKKIENGIHTSAKTARNRRSENKPNPSVELSYCKDGVDTYHIPKGKKWVRSHFDHLYVSTEGMYIHTGGTSNTLYGMEPLYKGHEPKHLSLRVHIPSGSYHLSQSYLKNMDCLMGLYRKGYPEPMWLGRPDLSGALYVQLPYMEFIYGDYFLLIVNLKPGDDCRDKFRPLGDCWCYDFEFMPNGIYLPHPSDFSYTTVHDQALNLCLSGYDFTHLDRFTAQFFDQEYHYMGAAQDIQPSDVITPLPLPQDYLWTDGDYHVVLQHNLFSFRYLKLSCTSGHIKLTDTEHLPESSPFYRLSIDVASNDRVLETWRELYGCREVKEKLLQFCATHSLDDYEHFCITAPPGFVPSPKVLAGLLYESHFYMECPVSHLIERFGNVSLKHLYNLYERENGPIVLGLTGLSDLLTAKGQTLVKDLENFVTQPYHSLILCCTEEEYRLLKKKQPGLAESFSDSNIWKANVPTIDEYIRMAEVILSKEGIRVSDADKSGLKKRLYQLSERIVGLSPREMHQMLMKDVVLPYHQRMAAGT